MSTPNPAPETLEQLASIIDASCHTAPGNIIIYATPDVDDLQLELQTLGDRHPFAALAGVLAPAEVWAVGVRATGSARHLDLPFAEPERVAFTMLVDRTGGEVSLIRVDDRVHDPHEPAEGVLPDACRRTLGLPTPPPPAPAAQFWATVWLDRAMEAWIEPSTRRLIASSWLALAALHPAARRARPASVATPEALAARATRHARDWGWSRIAADPPAALPDADLDPATAAWMDEGFLSRWLLGTYPPVERLATDLAELLEPPQRSRLLTVLEPALAVTPPRGAGW